MPITKYKVLISDVDGTLTPIAMGALPSIGVTTKIKTAVDKGLIFVMATGRPFSRLKYLIDYFSHVGLCIVDNGAAIINNDGRVIWEAILPNNHANKILELSKSFKLVRASCETEVFENPKTIPNSVKVRKISVHNISIGQAETLFDRVNSEFNDVTCVKAASYEAPHLVDVYFSNINATKQHAILSMAKILGINRREIIGVGDGYNDFSLLMACGLKVAMGNAVDELKEIADYIAPSVDNDGLVDVLEKYYFS